MSMTIPMKVEVFSRALVKPASPTPDHLKIFNLSFFDQIAPPVYIPLIFFYASSDPALRVKPVERFGLLKNSFSETLSCYYPLAGRLKDGDVIDCNDSGVEYFEAKVLDCELLDAIREPNVDELKKLLPFDPSSSHIGNVSELEPLMAVQVNRFDACGGIAISMCISHKVADTACFSTLLKGWAATARGSPVEDVTPNFDVATLFPARDTSIYDTNFGLTKEKVILKRLQFDASHISTLRAMSNPSVAIYGTKYPSRVQAVSSFIWKCFTNLAEANEKELAVIHTVNLRRRMDPPLPENAFGNMYLMSLVPAMPVPVETHHMVTRMTDSIKKFDIEYLTRLQGDGNLYLSPLGPAAEREFKGEANFLIFTSWCRFPLYEIDFGWGTPVWRCITTIPIKNFFVLLDTKSGDGVEVWLNIVERDYAAFERGLELSGVSNLTKSPIA